MDNENHPPRSGMLPDGLALADIPTLALQGALGNTVTLDLLKGDVLPSTYKFEDYFIVVQTGWVSLNHDNKAFCVLRPGEIFLQSAWLDEVEYAHRGITLSAETSVRLVLIERDSFLAVTEPNLMFSLHAFVFQRMLFLMKAVAQLNREHLPERLAHFLWDLSTPLPDGVRLIPPISPTTIADCLGIGLDELNQKREALKKKGHLIEQSTGEYLTAEVGAQARAAGYGRE